MPPKNQPWKVLREGFRGEVPICTQLFKIIQEKKNRYIYT